MHKAPLFFESDASEANFCTFLDVDKALVLICPDGEALNFKLAGHTTYHDAALSPCIFKPMRAGRSSRLPVKHVTEYGMR